MQPRTHDRDTTADLHGRLEGQRVVDQPSSAAPAEDRLVPGWLVRLAAIGWRVLVTLALALVLVGVAVELAVVVASIILALILAASLAPYVRERRARGWGRNKAAGVVSLAATVVIAAALAGVVIAVIPSLSAIIAAFDAGVAAIQQQLAALGISPDATGILQPFADGLRGMVLTGLADIAAAAANLVTVGILGGFLTFFLLQDGDRAWAWVTGATDGWRREALTEGGERAVAQVGGYVRGMSLTAVATALLAGVLMWVLGVPLAGPLAVAVLVAGFVPYVGRASAGILIVGIAVASRGVVPAAALLVLYVAGAFALDRVLVRFEAGRRLDLHPILAVLGLPIGFAAAGFFGMVVILPVLAFAQTAAAVLITTLGREPAPTAARPVASAEGVPVWLDRLGQWSWRALVAAALFLVVTQVALQFPAVIMPVVIAVILAATLGPASSALQRRGVGSTTAAAVVTVGTSVSIIAVIVITLASLAGPISQLMATAADGAEASGAQAIGIGSFVAAIGSGVIATVGAAVAGAIGIVVVLLLGGFLTFYFIRDGGRVWRAVSSGVPADRRRTLDAAGVRAVDVLGGYMLGTAAISAFGAASQLLIMVLLGLPLAVPLAVLALFAGFIPYVGGFIATFLAFLVAVSTGSQSAIVIMGIYTLVFNIIQGNFVTPLVYGKAVSLHPAIVLLAVPIGNALAGIVGMFLVVPVAGVIATTWRAILQTIDVDGAPDLEPAGSPEPGAAGPGADEPGQPAPAAVRG
jgi:predicted PurR-regulated permease PerM